MSKSDSYNRRVVQASALVIAASVVAVMPASAHNSDKYDNKHDNKYENAETDSYMAGDFHNHTTCTDGSTSLETLIDKSINTFDLDWMAQVGHGGTGTRDCRYDDGEYDSSKTGSGKLWDQTIGAAAIQGDVVNSTSYSPDGLPHRAMWRWQMLKEYVYPEVARMSKKLRNPMLFVGIETNAPGHEHVSATVLGAQKTEDWNWKTKPFGNADAVAEYEYRFDRSDTDMSGGPGGTAGVPHSGIWKGKVPNASGTGQGTANHVNKAVPSVAWMQANYPLQSFYVPAHVERAGVFDPNGNRGFNVEHFRDFNNAGPTVAVGFETMPGHQASNNRGEYRKNFGGAGIDSAGVTTYGGTGLYGAKIGGLWDAMLGEGRNWFFYASSDWHNRGSFSPYVRESTQDFYPGEYQKLYIPRPDYNSPWLRQWSMRPQFVVDSVRAGNSFSTSGDLVSGELSYTAEIVDSRKDDRHCDRYIWHWFGRGGKFGFGCIDWDYGSKKVAKMGETLVVPRGKSVKITLTVTDPDKANNSPYSFNNPSLLQVGIKQPLNKPKLDHVDFIRGQVTGVIAPTDPKYTDATNSTASIYATFDDKKWKKKGEKRTMSFTLSNVQSNQYIRARGTNLPRSTPLETDAQGNPLTDQDVTTVTDPNSLIPCKDTACPAHMYVLNNQKYSSYDVAAWSDLWFYTNPIFIRVSNQPKLLVEKNADLADKIARAGN